ncbi:hypothetical protein D0T51_00480 [Parabacteroides sp. 52]|uniref:hypothetical protein n=1 Tax=unclassified Parabacteroides TaxID=2649774 RepID=UPI0013D2E417|nr:MULTISPECIES: hypothetical protein [unclassified Parabacteroides]NDV54213.1 hypothetical protein [Parabacteroides sp. 52]
MIYILLPFCLFAQEYAEYNRKGREAMERKDYSDARMWFGEGVEYCDMYSIEQLTSIWMMQETMRPSMQNLMKRCFTCLLNQAQKNDTTAIHQVINYYTQGIGVEKDTNEAAIWTDKLNTVNTLIGQSGLNIEKKRREKMKFLLGYTFSTEAPIGLTLGGIHGNVGWYIRAKSNFSSMDYTNECRTVNAKSEITHLEKDKSYQADRAKSNKTKSLIGTAGIIFKTNAWLYLSVGGGYGERTLFSPFIVTDNNTSLTENIWCKNLDASYKGAVIETDAMFRFNKFFFSVGCHTMNFKYVDINAGLGIIF